MYVQYTVYKYMYMYVCTVHKYDIDTCMYRLCMVMYVWLSTKNIRREKNEEKKQVTLYTPNSMYCTNSSISCYCYGNCNVV